MNFSQQKSAVAFALLITLPLSPSLHAFTLNSKRPTTFWLNSVRPSAFSATALEAKKKKSPAAAALEKLNLDLLEDQDEPLSKKELLKQQKKSKKEEPTAEVEGTPEPSEKKLSKKELMLQKALDMEELDAPQQDGEDASSATPKLSKKELNELRKKEEKEKAKMEKKKLKKAQATVESSGVEEDVLIAPDDESSSPEDAPAPSKKQLTLEDKVRKERPPPRIRVMENNQPGYINLRMENVGITFRNQEVLKDVTWGVQTGDRVGLV